MYHFGSRLVIKDKHLYITAGERGRGMIAQDVIKIVPELVNEDKNGYFSVNYSNTCALLIEAIKEQQKEIDEIKKIIKEKL